MNAWLSELLEKTVRNVAFTQWHHLMGNKQLLNIVVDFDVKYCLSSG